MCIEKEQGFLKANRWYYEYTKETFEELLRRYPYIPFLVNNNTSKDIYYRWNNDKQVVEWLDRQEIDSMWQVGEVVIDCTNSLRPFLDFIVFTHNLPRRLYNMNMEVIIKPQYN